MKLSVIICTYNPRKDYLDQVLVALSKQSLPLAEWELVLIDNNSDAELSEQYDLSWHPSGRVVRESKPGLAHARIRGVNETSAPVIVFVDDDNVLETNYLEHALNILEQRPHLGCIGGKALPIYETPPPQWFDAIGLIGCRDLGDEVKITDFYAQQSEPVAIEEYPHFAPIGTGQVIRREAFLKYQQEVAEATDRTALGRTGKKLTSGEDNDIVLTILKHGWDVGYFPALYVSHLIPSRRADPAYLAKLNHAMARSWVYVLHLHSICPWPAIPKWSVWPRKVKNYFQQQAWRGGPNYLRWKGNCGMYEGLADIYPS